MEKPLNKAFDLLIGSVSNMVGVQSIGKSGGKALPETNESDIDLFVFCDEIPGVEIRQAAIDRLGDLISESKISASGGRHWGICDFVCLHEREICLMYFTAAGMEAEIDAILDGDRLEKEDNYFYPTGRCATFQSLHIFTDQSGFIASMKEKLSLYPAGLSRKLIAHHLGALEDVEDLERAVSRGDALFYHFALDIAIDHFLQALYAANRCYFPSRKRTFQYIAGFSLKPSDCVERLARVIELGGKADTLPQSYTLWTGLCADLAGILTGVSQPAIR